MKIKTAYTLAIKALGDQQKRYHPGHFEFLRSQGTFAWAETEHKKWVRLQTAKEILVREMQQEQQEQQLEFGAVGPTPSPLAADAGGGPE